MEPEPKGKQGTTFHERPYAERSGYQQGGCHSVFKREEQGLGSGVQPSHEATADKLGNAVRGAECERSSSLSRLVAPSALSLSKGRKVERFPSWLLD